MRAPWRCVPGKCLSAPLGPLSDLQRLVPNMHRGSHTAADACGCTMGCGHNSRCSLAHLLSPLPRLSLDRDLDRELAGDLEGERPRRGERERERDRDDDLRLPPLRVPAPSLCPLACTDRTHSTHTGAAPPRRMGASVHGNCALRQVGDADATHARCPHLEPPLSLSTARASRSSLSLPARSLLRLRDRLRLSRLRDLSRRERLSSTMVA